MMIASRADGWGCCLILAALMTAQVAGAQTPSMPSTVRYGSGLVDIPVSSVLPHMAVTGTLSGFFLSLDRSVQVDALGNEIGFSRGSDGFYTDASLAVGLFDRLEAGASLQSFEKDSGGGNVWGLFGRLRLWEPIDQGLGVAVGARYLTGPDFGDGVEYSPNRLGIADRRLSRNLIEGTDLSLYGVATAYLHGFDGGPLPENDLTFSLGFGTGMFREGGTLGFYAPGHANGWFYGTALHIGTSERSLLSLMAEHNGFDVNVGAQFDWSGARIGVQYLASNHATPPGGHSSEYQKPRLGFLGSVAICPNESGLLCRPRRMRRAEPDTIWIPPPPPDTVMIATAPARVPVGEEATVCLSTGQSLPIRVTAAADTLVGPDFVPIRTLRPGVVFAGVYASGAFWFESDEAIVFEGAAFGKSPDTFPVDCDQILRVGAYEGVPVFADQSADRPLVVLFVPVRAGVWQRYERGLP